MCIHTYVPSQNEKKKNSLNWRAYAYVTTNYMYVDIMYK